MLDMFNISLNIMEHNTLISSLQIEYLPICYSSLINVPRMGT
jgi:hypothetical protein